MGRFPECTFLKETFSFFLLAAVADTTPPVINDCPTTLSFVVPFGTPSRTVIWEEPTATDDSGAMPTLIARSHQPGDSFPVGTTQVVYTFTDASGNRAMCSFSITVGEFLQCNCRLCFFVFVGVCGLCVWRWCVWGCMCLNCDILV